MYIIRKGLFEMKNQEVAINAKREEIEVRRKAANETKAGTLSLIGFLSVFAGGLIILMMYLLAEYGKEFLNIIS